jgi:hypothetical protein
MRSFARLATAVEERLLVPTYASRWPAAPVAAHRGLALPLQLRGPVRRLRAETEAGPLRIAAAGRAKLLAPMVERWSGQSAPVAAEAACGLWRPGTLGRLDADLILAEVHRWAAPRFRRAGWMVVPDAVRWVGALSEVPGPSPCHSVREDRRKVRNAGFTLVPAGSAADWELFTGRMLAPQALARFGDDAWVPSASLLAELRRAGSLHLVLLDGRAVAGIFAVRRGDSVWFPVSGVLDGDPTLFRRGASLAALTLGFEWARAAGCRRVDAGRTGPFLRDGVPRLKRKWGLRPVVDPLAHVVAVRVRSPVARAAILRDPVLIETAQGIAEYHGVGT